jgi:DNA-binding MarR family transcriptional regulator
VNINTDFINQHPDVNGIPWAVATALCQFAGKDVHTDTSLAAICKMTGFSKTAVKTALRKLQEKQIIEVLHDFYEDGACKSNTYVILAPANKITTDRVKINFHNRGAYEY